MVEIDPLTGLPKELGIGEILAKDSQIIRIKKRKARFGKMVTIIEGINSKDINMKELAKKLKKELACGGTVKEGLIELQGDHNPRKIKEILIKEGFDPERIKI